MKSVSFPECLLPENSILLRIYPVAESARAERARSGFVTALAHKVDFPHEKDHPTADGLAANAAALFAQAKFDTGGVHQAQRSFTVPVLQCDERDDESANGPELPEMYRD